jgi:hypothetical protein
MGFDPCNRFLKIWESISTPTSKVGVHLGVWRFNFHTLPYSQPPMSMKCDSWASLLARNLASRSIPRKTGEGSNGRLEKTTNHEGKSSQIDLKSDFNN